MAVARWLAAIVIVGIVGIFGTLAAVWWQHTRGVTLPSPAGPFAVGRADFDWMDTSRHRELTVWIWYPAASRSGDAAEYMPAPLRRALEGHWGPALRLLTHELTRVHAHAIAGAALAPGRFPAIVLKPGIGALALDYTALAEDLASYGYFVAASDSPGSTAVVVYRDGRVATRTAALHPPESNPEAFEKVLRVWVDDDRFVLDQMEARFPIKGVGAIGHSFGGATALQFCAEERRCEAAIDVDGAPFGDVARSGAIGKPGLFILSDHTNDRSAADDRIRATIRSVSQRLPNQPNVIVIPRSRHFNFADDAFVKNAPVAKAIGLLGPGDERQVFAATANAVHRFFDKYARRRFTRYSPPPSARQPHRPSSSASR